ncbi:Caspase-3 [Liparis tanakae]|uniref:Caspase-3 n=1 Tax=Liparis tanakae TaxID=230148 RepID=A0A4Z2EJK8_9TELE|nr:Caspase-3 [Liparis tanakae]
MHPLGSVFLQTFCSLLQQKDFRQLELSRLLTRLAHRVAFRFRASGAAFRGKKEMPCLVSRMTREAFPFAEPGSSPQAH